jgi:hypothetical protein
MNRDAKFTIDKWTKYRDDFFLRNDASGILKASFVICKFLSDLEFSSDPSMKRVYETPENLNRNLEQLHKNSETRGNKTPGFNYRRAGEFLRLREGVPFKYQGIMLFKKRLQKKTYGELVSGMVRAVEEKTRGITKHTPIKEIFEKTGYVRGQSTVMGGFFYHSLVMYGWYMCWGLTPMASKRPKVIEFPGSCNVQACINMYIFKKLGIEDRIVYVAHGKALVDSKGHVNPLTAHRAAGMDSVQFCHHAFKEVDVQTGIEGGYFGNHYIKVYPSHIDAFDIITLAPIFRAIQRLRKLNKPYKVALVERVLGALQTDMKHFIHTYLMMHGVTKSTKENIIPSRILGNRSIQKFRENRAKSIVKKHLNARRPKTVRAA